MGQLVNQARRRVRLQSGADGFSIIEVIISTGILATGLLTLAAFMAYGMRYMAGSSFAVVAREKAREAVESVHTARDTKLTSWPDIRNEDDGGVFLNGETPLTRPGPDGLVNTDDDEAAGIESLRTPGADGTLGNGDDVLTPLSNFTRQVEITDLLRDGTTEVNNSLRQITVTIKYTVQGLTRSYSITTYVSSFS
jgi:type II secretory pathway pseudopilin PulG